MNPPPLVTDPTDVNAVRAWLAVHSPNVDAVRAWATGVLADLGPVPALGTAAWVALADTDPRKLAAALAPAVARLLENTPAAVAMRLRRELLAEDRAVAERFKAASVALSTAQDWTRAARRPSFAELERRRAEIPVTRPTNNRRENAA